MRVALGLGRRGQGNTWPNPAVGCVIAHGERIVGRGWTQPGGRPHAETQALAQAGAAAHGATAYVTLEPCAHHGRTPPCSEALIAAGIARVVVAADDPDPRVSGRGFSMLRGAGIQVTVGVLAKEAARDLGGFLSRVQRGRPELLLKLATSFDGRIATAGGQSKWITGPGARRAVHAMRARHDAVMVGAGTVRADDPMLTVRGMGARYQPVRIAVSRRLTLPLMSQFAQTARDVPVWLIHGPDADAAAIAAWESVGAHLIACPLRDAGLDMMAAMQALGAAGLTRIFCEGGGALAASLLKADVVDRLAGFTAGLALGADGRAAIGALGLDVLSDAPRFSLEDVQAVDGDALHLWRRV
ncbi:bifunctional diaminohydroxyphosphoribosylaminopyrimidine deaminase/5-amino-6-(5-phosphoribosylamino)uracil reductase RibD [Roseovarius sp. M141]|uniref:bifunctional diaminohydroxyphosphoribosylaminopyrimidine deaminase/5-amino-6-(5-phosphoribosylamino)uracil reductase RibD n=1 Tax=Roseovarius sp. M141 TaxID=2583806 RepID=UPI0020CD15C1|nr:bifunctional diaminohydroxyphosphoribosylaminopyrimidine deaminase/5-amino-6-(5-phosphoribosylamino)uracil reductase RibD [Roseovarius sp. M141]MCQ0092092.1 bifunctional diaminohydroxyphosphoribosylaminopyrimidine deaminase/5-amino-6-(5-phosphoribosylamino)uracil reductase RibD [Roseovarius sp. M141]